MRGYGNLGRSPHHTLRSLSLVTLGVVARGVLWGAVLVILLVLMAVVLLLLLLLLVVVVVVGVGNQCRLVLTLWTRRGQVSSLRRRRRHQRGFQRRRSD